jgi:hypothetical protein
LQVAAVAQVVAVTVTEPAVAVQVDIVTLSVVKQLVAVVQLKHLLYF